MNKENTEKLFTDFPRLFKGKDLGMHANLMCFGFEFGDGWFDLIYQLCVDLDAEYQKLSPENIADAGEDGYIVFQAKEKFGGLRFYTDSGTDEMHKLIDVAENKSFTICEYCGKAGKTRGGGWIKTLCDEHHAEQEKKRQEYREKARLVAEQREKEKENGS
jgi:hypothetical protein